MTNQEILGGFAAHLAEDGKRPATIDSYVGDISAFLAYLEERGEDFSGDMRRRHVTAYRSNLLESGYEAATVNKKINSLQALNRWLLDAGLTEGLAVDPGRDRVKVAAGSERQVEVYPEEQLQRLLLFVQGGRTSARDRAIVITLLYTGVRVGELCGLKLRSVDLLTGQIRVTGKGGKVREVPLRPEAAEAISDYLAVRAESGHAATEELFLGQRGPIQRDAVNTLLERIAERAGLDVRLRPHTFRHTFCTRLVQRGVPLTVVSKLAGHANVETTARFYVDTSREDKMRAVNIL